MTRGLETLLRKAAAEPAFREFLLEQRSAAAPEAGIELDPTETAMLDRSPRGNLEGMIAVAGRRPPGAVAENPRLLAVRGIRPDGPIFPDRPSPDPDEIQDGELSPLPPPRRDRSES